MNERVELHSRRRILLIPGLVLVGIGIYFAALAWPTQGAVRSDSAMPLLVIALMMVALGLWSMVRAQKAVLRVVVDHGAITDYRLNVGPIPWAVVARMEQAVGEKGIPALRLVLRPVGQDTEGGKPGRREVVIQGADLTGGLAALKLAAERLAPQVTRDW